MTSPGIIRSEVTWSRWPPCPYMYMVKTCENRLLRNRMADDLETWYTPLGTQALPGLFKWWPLVDVDLFYGKIVLGKGKTVDLCEAIEAYNIQSWYTYTQSPKWTFITAKGQGYLLTFVLDASDSVFLSSSLNLQGCLKPDHMWSPCGTGEWKFVHGIWV